MAAMSHYEAWAEELIVPQLKGFFCIVFILQPPQAEWEEENYYNENNQGPTTTREEVKDSQCLKL